jgi:hypothetical protein
MCIMLMKSVRLKRKGKCGCNKQRCWDNLDKGISIAAVRCHCGVRVRVH